MNRWTAILALMLATNPAFGQMPDLKSAAVVWEGEIAHREVRVLQLPRNAMALIPLRFFLEVPKEESKSVPAHTGDASCPDCASTTSPMTSAEGLIDRFDHAELAAQSGVEAALTFAPRRHSLRHWGADIIEVRETFRAPGAYRLTFASEAEPALRVPIVVEVRPFRYLAFGEEFGLFVAGCLVIAMVMMVIIFWLHRRGRRQRKERFEGAIEY